MHASITRLDFIYEAKFAQPALNFATDPRPVIKSLVKSVSSRWSIASKDVFLWPSQRANEVRLRVSLFSGQGTFEVDADKIGVSFENARYREDWLTIQECLKLGLDGIAEALPSDRLGDHMIRTMMHVKLLDKPADAREFLSSLTPMQHKELRNEAAPKGTTMTPSLKFELDNPEEKWIYFIDVGRAYRDSTEVFMTTTLTCLDGNRLGSVEERLRLFDTLLVVAWTRLGIQGQETVKSASAQS